MERLKKEIVCKLPTVRISFKTITDHVLIVPCLMTVKILVVSTFRAGKPCSSEGTGWCSFDLGNNLT